MWDHPILRSASKLAFLALTVTVCAGFLLKILPVEQFTALASAAFGYYFGRNRGDQSETAKD